MNIVYNVFNLDTTENYWIQIRFLISGKPDVLEKMVLRLYGDMVAGRISEANFNLMLDKTQREQAELKKRVEAIQEYAARHLADFTPVWV